MGSRLSTRCRRTTIHLGYYDAFVTKFNPSGSALIYSTYLGGTGSEFSLYGGAIAVDSDGNAYVGGSTGRRIFPAPTGNSNRPTVAA